MDRKISHLEPKPVWGYFEDICQVPRPSKKEEKIIRFLEDFAHDNNLNYKKDNAGNVLITAPATKGYEDTPTVVLQSHMDMVGEKNNSIEHDFEKDAIKPYIDGDWIKAEGTTLGADCGIGMAASMAVLTSKDIEHGPVECLFTVDEETGLSGAFALEPGFFDGKILLNLDSEDEGELFIGCAGGIDTLANFHFKKEDIPNGYFPLELNVSGLLGGHSGDDIHKGRANAIKILVRFMWEANRKYGIRIATLEGGNLRNAIAREAHAVILVRNAYKENLVADFNVFKHEITEEISVTEPKISIDHESTDAPTWVLDEQAAENLLDALFICPHGIHTMSFRMPDMVETSTNLASVKFEGDNNSILVTTSQRSDRESGKKEISSVVEAVFEKSGAGVRHSDGYPGWTPNPESPVLKTTVEAYKKLFNQEPIVRSVHAGLECGLFLKKYPGLDMVSFGPTILGAHSPDERISIETVQKFWKHLVEVLKHIQ
ncbi:MAG: aminoacyl-histidine dipeptidase [Prolixibacteraceae bacterium]|jgi:dipeptidase D|nr:aminoacyl-histidine dipeptidase [Prolixibacteraceae bacterium]